MLIAPTGRRVVGRGVAEAADGDRVRRPRARARPSCAAALDRERDADRARQVGRDRGGLRDDREVGAAEHLVPAAGDRLVGRGDEAEQHVAQPARRRRPGGRGPGRRRRSGSAAARDRWVAAPRRPRRCPRDPTSRSCRSPGRVRAASARRGRGGGCRAGRRTARGPRVRSARCRDGPGRRRRAGRYRTASAVTTAQRRRSGSTRRSARPPVHHAPPPVPPWCATPAGVGLRAHSWPESTGSRRFGTGM